MNCFKRELWYQILHGTNFYSKKFFENLASSCDKTNKTNVEKLQKIESEMLKFLKTLNQTRYDRKNLTKTILIIDAQRMDLVTKLEETKALMNQLENERKNFSNLIINVQEEMTSLSGTNNELGKNIIELTEKKES